jgi:Coenzyme PQQ synthesis protein D (PqqD)
MTTLDSTVKVADDVICQEMDDEAVLLNMRTEIYFGLNAMGTRIWALLKSDAQIRTVAQALLDEYDIGADDVQRNLLDFVEQLHSKGLITIQQG